MSCSVSILLFLVKGTVTITILCCCKETMLYHCMWYHFCLLREDSWNNWKVASVVRVDVSFWWNVSFVTLPTHLLQMDTCWVTAPPSAPGKTASTVSRHGCLALPYYHTSFLPELMINHYFFEHLFSGTGEVLLQIVKHVKKVRTTQRLSRSCSDVKHRPFMLTWIFKALQSFSITTDIFCCIFLALSTWCHHTDMWFLCVLGCGKTTGADVLGVESEPWVFKGGVSGEVQVRNRFVFILFILLV